MILTLVALLLPAHADVDDTLDHGWYLYERGEMGAAMEVAARLLRDDPTLHAGHRLYLRSALSERVDVDAGILVREYRAWHAASPEDPVRRTALALALAHAEDQVPCEEVEDVLGPVPADPDGVYHHLRLRFDAAEDCGWDADALERAIADLGASSHGAIGFTLRRRFAAGTTTDADLAAWRALVAARPTQVATGSRLFGEGDASAVTRRARRLAVSLAVDALRSERPEVVHGAREVLSVAKHPRADEAAARHRALTGVEETDPLIARVREADRRPTFAEKEEALAALEDVVPPSGAARARLEEARAGMYEGLERPADAAEAVGRAWRADPTPARANEYAWAAAIGGVALDSGLQAVREAVAAVRASGPESGQDWEAFRERRASRLAAYLDTEAWLLHRLGRHAEALAAQAEAIDLSGEDSPDLRLRWGVILDAAGHPDTARRVLLGALPGCGPEDPGYAESRSVLTARLADDPRAWMAPELRLALLDVPSEPAPDDAGPDEQDGSQHIGELFPLTRFTVDGAEVGLEDFPGPLVIDLWATWCGPCIAGMPHLDALTRRYADAGLRVLGVSLDSDEATVRRYLGRNPSVAWTVAWYGRKGFADAGVQGIPTQFVLDAEHRVVGVVSGWGGPGDGRLEALVKQALGM